MKNFIRTMMATAVMAIFCFVGQAVAEITVASWGGAYTMSQQKAYADTFSDSPLVGGKANFVNYNGGLGEVRTQVESGNVQWDIVDVLPHEARVGCDEGLFEELPRNVFAKAPDGTPMDKDMFVPLPNDCVVPQIWWSYMAFYKKGTFSGAQPKTIGDFFNVSKFPGKRGIHTWANALIEMALMADGVPPANVYKEMSSSGGIDRAFAKLNTIKDHVVFWSSGSKPLELVTSGEVSMALAYNGRVGAAILSENAPFVPIWDGQVLEEEWLVMLKGSNNYDEALRFLVHASAPAQQAGQAKWINYGPMRKSGMAILAANEPFFHNGKNIMPHMPNTDEHMKGGLYANPEWWADNGASIAERFNAWKGK